MQAQKPNPAIYYDIGYCRPAAYSPKRKRLFRLFLRQSLPHLFYTILIYRYNFSIQILLTAEKPTGILGNTVIFAACFSAEWEIPL
jgi:hypothetical protein